MAFALEALGKQVRHRQRRCRARALLRVPRHRPHRDRGRDDDGRRRGDRDGVQRPDPHRRRRARASASSSTSITTPATACTARSTGSTSRPRRAARWCSTSSARSACRSAVEIATHIYLAILTDTGSFHHSNITPRTFDICRQTVEAGREPGDHGAARLRQQQLRQAEADRRAARPDGAGRRRAAGGPVHGRRDARGVRLHATTTPKG